MKLEKFVQKEIEKLVVDLNAESDGWSFENGKLTKYYEFDDFNSAFSFMTMSALYAEKVDHHPEWFNVYNKVKVQLITHNVSGVSYKDAELAKKMDSYAKCLAISI